MPTKSVVNTFSPVTPIGEAAANLIAAFGTAGSSAYDRQRAAKIKQEMEAPAALQDLFSRAYGLNNTAPPEVTNPNVTQADIDKAYAPPSAKSREDMVRGELPALAGTLAKAGAYGNIGDLFRVFTMNAPGLKDTEMMDRSMMGAGQPYSATQSGFKEEEAGKDRRSASIANGGSTAAMRMRDTKIEDAMRLYGLDEPTATSLADGIIQVVQDANSGNTFLVNRATGARKLMADQTTGGQTPSAPGLPGGQSPDIADAFTDALTTNGVTPAPEEGAPEGGDDFVSIITAPGASSSAGGGGPGPVGGNVPLTKPGGPMVPETKQYDFQPKDIAIPVEKSVGMLPTAKRAVNATVGQVFPAATMMGAEGPAQDMLMLKQKAIKAFSATGGRPPVIEQERIVSLFPPTKDQGYAATGLENPKVARENLRQLAGYLVQQRDADVQALQDPNLDRNSRNEINGRVREVNGLLTQLLTPDAVKKLNNGGKTAPKPKAAAPAAGGMPADVTEDDIQHTMKIHNMTREQVLQKLQGGR